MQFRIGVPIKEFAMPYPSPLDYLTAFALAFLGGVLSSICLGKYINSVRKEASAHA
ncbi:hypothetical protein AB1286_14175 [Trinickia sp. NRRL B-1857]|uniref:hypothetical protein n=1 Tax=Trinickia sp. NRRL B-1857 TaxID=3162879 RepID=UPI003D2B97BE